MTVEIRKIEHTMMYLATFARSYHTFHGIYRNLDVLDSNTENLYPFRNICNALLYDAAISWCKVFGTNAEETHWKAIVKDEKEFRKVLFTELNVSKEEFHAYWIDMTEFRNNVVAHFNSEYFEIGTTPLFDMAMKSAAVAHKYMSEQNNGATYTGPTCLDTYGKQAASIVLDRLHL